MSKKCVAFSKSKLGLETADNRKSFYAGWDAALAEQEEQEPVGVVETSDEWGVAGVVAAGTPVGTKLYAAPVRTKDLTDDELREIHHLDQFGLFCDYDDFEQIARAVIAADREKNK